jgi:hypothetical protein
MAIWMTSRDGLDDLDQLVGGLPDGEAAAGVVDAGDEPVVDGGAVEVGTSDRRGRVRGAA